MTSFQFSHGSDFLCQISFHSLFLLDVRTTLRTNCAVRDDIKRAIADRAVQAKKYRVDYGIDWRKLPIKEVYEYFINCDRAPSAQYTITDAERTIEDRVDALRKRSGWD